MLPISKFHLIVVGLLICEYATETTGKGDHGTRYMYLRQRRSTNCTEEIRKTCINGHCRVDNHGHVVCHLGCVAGRTGGKCDLNCTENCTHCEQYGKKCKACVKGTFGSECNESCPYCKYGCERKSGHCVFGCSAGHYGNFCTQSCPINCRSSLVGEPGPCGQHSGHCTSGCVQGYRGIFCNNTCNWFKDSCNDVVDTTCESCRSEVSVKDKDPCGTDIVRADKCKDGCRGNKCDKLCRKRCVVCDRYKDVCTRCVMGWYGPKCEAHCPPHCSSNDCDMNGHCNVDKAVTLNSSEADGYVVPVTMETLAHMEESQWGPVLVGGVCVLAVFVIMVALTVKFCVFPSEKTRCCFDSSESLSVDGSNGQWLSGRRFGADNGIEDVDNGREERVRFSNAYLHAIAEELQQHPHSHPRPNPHTYRHPTRSGYETLNFQLNADSDHRYAGLSCIETSRL